MTDEVIVTEVQEIPLNELLEAAAQHDLARIREISLSLPDGARTELRTMCSLLFHGLKDPGE